MRPFAFCTFTTSVLLAAGATAGYAEERLAVFVSIPPQAYFVERIGGAHVLVRVLVGPGQSPHTFEPTPKQMVALGGAALYFKLGMPFERRLLRKIQAGHRGLTVVDMAYGVEKRVMIGRHQTDVCPDDPEARYADERDPHVWLSPPLMKILAENVAGALQNADPSHAADYRRNLELFLRDLEAVDARIRAGLRPFEGRTFYVFHPAFGYFGDAYGLRQQAVEVEGKSPTPKQLAALINRARSEEVSIILAQPQFDQQSANAVATAIGGAVVSIDPLAKDVLSNLEDIAASIERALSK